MVRRFTAWLFLLFFIAVLGMYFLYESSYVQKRIYPLKYREEIIQYSNEHGLDPYLVMGIIWVESKFNPQATSGKEAKGLMQIIPGTGQWIAEQINFNEYEEDILYDPETNIMFGCWYFSHLLQAFEGDVELALASYNGGIGNVKRWLKDSRYSDDGKNLNSIPFRETSDYLERIIDTYKRYKKLYEI